MESAEEKSDLFTVLYIKHSLTAKQKEDESNNVFFCAFEQMNLPNSNSPCCFFSAVAA